MPAMRDAGQAVSNREVAELLRDVATALRIKGEEPFQARSYESAARGVEHTTEPVRELWRQHRLAEIPGIGGSIAGHLDEWFRTGRSQRFEDARSGLPDVVLELVHIPGVGPATAVKLAAAGVEDLDDLERKAQNGKLLERGISARTVNTISTGLAELSRRPSRMLLPAAEAMARPLIQQMRRSDDVSAIEIAGSVRRRCATAANIDIVVRMEHPEGLDAVVSGMREVERHERVSGTAVDGGERRRGRSDVEVAQVTLHNGARATVVAARSNRFGATLQWLTGSRAHNSALVQRAAERGMSLGVDGVHDRAGRPLPTPAEEDVYRLLGMAMPPPELREDWGDIDAAVSHALPRLITSAGIRGDCHSHTTWSDGSDSAARMIEAARAMGREYLVITDHSYPNLAFARRAVEIEQLRAAFPDIHIVNGLEVNITVEGGLQVPDEVLAAHQFCLASIHTGFRQPREVITRRLLAALAHPAINGIAHPTGRLLLRREGIEANWDAVFDACLRYDKFLEIDGPADRLDLPDHLVREAVRRGVKLVVDSDAHAVEELINLLGGIDVARRGWAEVRHVLNTLPYGQFAREAHVRE